MIYKNFKQYCLERKTPKQLINFQVDKGKMQKFNNPDAPPVTRYKLKFWNEYLGKRNG